MAERPDDHRHPCCLRNITGRRPYGRRRTAHLHPLLRRLCHRDRPQCRRTPGEDALRRQFARTPYAVSFLSAERTFILVTLHVIYGEDADQRVPELGGIAEWLADWARRENSWSHNLIALGDFNIDRVGDQLYDAFTSTGLRTPQELNEVPCTIFGSAGEAKHYDQIAWFTGEGGVPELSLRFTQRAGHFDFTTTVLGTLTKQQISWRVSDHYPLWAEFSVKDI